MIIENVAKLSNESIANTFAEEFKGQYPVEELTPQQQSELNAYLNELKNQDYVFNFSDMIREQNSINFFNYNNKPIESKDLITESAIVYGQCLINIFGGKWAITKPDNILIVTMVKSECEFHHYPYNVMAESYNSLNDRFLLNHLISVQRFILNFSFLSLADIDEMHSPY